MWADRPSPTSEKAQKLLLSRFVEHTLEPIIDDTLKLEKDSCVLEEQFDEQWSSNPGSYDEQCHGQLKSLRIGRIRLHLLIRKALEQVPPDKEVLDAEKLEPFFLDLVFDEMLSVTGLPQGLSQMAEEARNLYLTGKLEDG